MKKDKYLLSVIVPIYNVEDYLETAIESVINQSIGFNNIELILVNDGSPANEDTICKKYAENYNNIVYIEKENGGVSSARNVGIDAATSDYVFFFDPDDILEKNMFEDGIKMLEENEEINFVTFRQHFFEAEDGYHPVDYKFDKGSRIVDITKDYECIQLCVFNVIRKSAIKNIRFDEKIRFSEDAKFMTDILFKNKSKKYGLVTSSEYLYRKRKNGSSAVQTSSNSIEWYSYTSKNVYDYVFELSKEVFGSIIPYAQYFVMYHLRHKIKVEPSYNISKEEFIKHDEHIIKLLKQIDDNIILEQRRFTLNDKVFALNIKNGKDIQNDITIKDKDVFYKNIKFGSLDECFASINDIYKEGNDYIIEIAINSFINDSDLKIIVNGKYKNIKYDKYTRSYYNNFDKYSYEEKLFRIKIDNNSKIEILYNDKQLPIKSNSYIQIVNENIGYYKFYNNYLYVRDNVIYFNNNVINKIKYNLKYNMYLISKKKNVFLTILLSKFYFKNEIVVILNENNEKIIKEYLKDNNINNYKVLYKNNIKRNIKTKLLFLKASAIYEDNIDSNPINLFGRSKLYYINAVKGNYYAFISKNEDKSRYNKIKLFNKNTKCIQIEK